MIKINFWKITKKNFKIENRRGCGHKTFVINALWSKASALIISTFYFWVSREYMQSIGFFWKKLERKICWILRPKTFVVYSLRPILSARQISLIKKYIDFFISFFLCVKHWFYSRRRCGGLWHQVSVYIEVITPRFYFKRGRIGTLTKTRPFLQKVAKK